MTARTTFARRLKALRERAGLTRYALAKKIGLTTQGVVYLESGERKPTWETVQLLALALGADFQEFADPALSLPTLPPPKPRGRPRKV